MGVTLVLVCTEKYVLKVRLIWYRNFQGKHSHYAATAYKRSSYFSKTAVIRKQVWKNCRNRPVRFSERTTTTINRGNSQRDGLILVAIGTNFDENSWSTSDALGAS